MFCMVLTTSATAALPRCATSEAVPASWFALAGVVRVLLHRGSQLFHRGGGFFQVGGLLLGAARQVVVARGDLVGAHGDLFHAPVDRRHRAGQAFLHALDGREHQADLVAVADLDPAGEVAFGDPFEAGAGFLQGAQHHAAQEQPCEQGQREGDDDHGDGDHAGAPVVDRASSTMRLVAWSMKARKSRAALLNVSVTLRDCAAWARKASMSWAVSARIWASIAPR